MTHSPEANRELRSPGDARVHKFMEDLQGAHKLWHAGVITETEFYEAIEAGIAEARKEGAKTNSGEFQQLTKLT